MPELEERQAKIECILEQVDKRIGNLESRMESLESGQNQIRSEFASYFKWVIGIIVTMWITIILSIIIKT